MTDIMTQIAILFIIMFAGVCVAKIGILDEPCANSLNKIVIKITFPAMIIANMDQEFTMDRLISSIQMIKISICCYVAVVIFFEIWRKVSKRTAKQLGLLQFLVLFGNTAFLGYPVIYSIYGEIGVFYGTTFNLVHNFACYSYGLFLLQRDKKIVFHKVLLNVSFVSTIIGFINFLLSSTLPYIVHRPLEWVGNMTIPLCLLLVGSKLARIKIGELIRPPVLWPTIFIRLLIFPAVLYPTLYLLGFRHHLLIIPTIIFGTPVALTAAAFAEEYDADDNFAGKAVVLSNLLAVITIPILVMLIINQV